MSPTLLLKTTRLGTIAIAAVALATGLLSAPSGPASAETSTMKSYFVDCSRARSGTGSLEDPWNTLGAVNRHAAFLPGESVLLKRGTACAGRLRPRGEGSARAQIVLGAFGKGKLPTVAGGGTADQTGVVQLENQAHWTIQDLHITNRSAGAETNAYRSAVLIRNFGGRRAGVVIQRLRIDSVVSNLAFSRNDPREFGGISVQTEPQGRLATGFDGLRILNNRITGVGRTGIVVSNHGYPKTSDRDLRISGNTVTRSRGDSIVVRGSVKARIDHNVSADGASLWPCKQCGRISPDTANAAIWPALSKNVTIEYNEVYGTHDLGGDGVAIDADLSAENTIIQYNYLHGNEGGGILFCGSKDTAARFNVLQNNDRGAFVFIGGIPAYNSKIYNNTVYTAVGTEARVVHSQGGKGGKGISFFNNLIYNLDDSGYYVWPTKPKTRTNTYIGVHGIGEPAEAGKGWSDPGLRAPGSGGKGFTTLGGYRPVSPKNDPLGSPIPKSVKVDFFGKAINPTRPPRGAAG